MYCLFSSAIPKPEREYITRHPPSNFVLQRVLVQDLSSPTGLVKEMSPIQQTVVVQRLNFRSQPPSRSSTEIMAVSM